MLTFLALFCLTFFIMIFFAGLVIFNKQKSLKKRLHQEGLCCSAGGCGGCSHKKEHSRNMA